MNNCRKLVFNGLVFGQKAASTMSKEFDKRSFQRLCCTMPAGIFDAERDKKEFCEALPKIIEDLSKHPRFEEVPIAKEWVKKVVNGAVTGGKLGRGLATVMSYKLLENPEKITPETIRLAHVLGWCTEFFESYCVVLDDMMDGSLTRRGKPCWYLQEDVGIPHAVNDATLIYYCLHRLIRNNFENSHMYVKLYQEINEVLLCTSMGQFLDIRGSQHKNKYDLFTTEAYEDIITYKSAIYTYKMPIYLGMVLSNHLSEESLKNVEEISIPLGRLFQMQDDYIDCFGDESLTGKFGTDIQEGKCSWLAVNALARCNANSRAVFLACYGSRQPAHIERIKQLYIQLQLPQLYKQQEREIYDKIINKIESVSSPAERELYRNLLNITYGRKK